MTAPGCFLHIACRSQMPSLPPSIPLPPPHHQSLLAWTPAMQSKQPGRHPSIAPLAASLPINKLVTTEPSDKHASVAKPPPNTENQPRGLQNCGACPPIPTMTQGHSSIPVSDLWEHMLPRATHNVPHWQHSSSCLCLGGRASRGTT
jgi:hypothetical protein